MSKPNVSEGFRQKVKQFFGVKKGHVITSSVYEGPKPDELIFDQELLQVYIDLLVCNLSCRCIVESATCIQNVLSGSASCLEIQQFSNTHKQYIHEVLHIMQCAILFIFREMPIFEMCYLLSNERFQLQWMESYI